MPFLLGTRYTGCITQSGGITQSKSITDDDVKHEDIQPSLIWQGERIQERDTRKKETLG